MPINAVRAIPLSSFDTNSLTGNYDMLCDGLDEACFLLRITNNSNRNVTISYDGSTDQDFSLISSIIECNAQSNSLPPSYVAVFQKGQKVYIKGTAGGTGYIYMAGYYV